MNFRTSLNMLDLLIAKLSNCCLLIQDFLKASRTFEIKTLCMHNSSINFQSAGKCFQAPATFKKSSQKKILKPER